MTFTIHCPNCQQPQDIKAEHDNRFGCQCGFAITHWSDSLQMYEVPIDDGWCYSYQRIGDSESICLDKLDTHNVWISDISEDIVMNEFYTVEEAKRILKMKAFL